VTFYSIDRAPETVAKQGHPVLQAWTRKEARDGFVKADAGHREAVRAPVAAHLCRMWYRCELSDAVKRGVI
jgi:hypothetical protein